MKIHELHIRSNFMDKILSGKKTFEIRKNDRDFQVGDLIQFLELGIVDDEKFIMQRYKIVYILHSHEFPNGIPEDYCVMSIERYVEDKSRDALEKLGYYKLERDDRIYYNKPTFDYNLKTKICRHYDFCIYLYKDTNRVEIRYPVDMETIIALAEVMKAMLLKTTNTR